MTAILVLALFPFVVLTTFFATEVALGMVRYRRARDPEEVFETAVIVVPAHDEAAVIDQSLRLLSGALGRGMHILVVADNCTDDTAERVRQAGLQVIERNDVQNRGKGHALTFAASMLEAAPPDVIVVIDADCAIDAQSLRAIVAEAFASKRPCQAVNLIRPSLDGSPLVQISTFAFFVKNSIRQRGLQRLAGRVHLTGTGMALPFFLFQRTGEVAGSVVEDLAFGIQLAEDGYPPKLIDQAIVWSGASTQAGTLVQRRRWEGGFLSLSSKHGWQLIWRGITHLDLRSTLAGMDLLIPPLALFSILNVSLLAIATLAAFAFDLGRWPIVVHGVALAVAFFAVACTWFGEGRKFISPAALLRIPIYVFWKLPLYAAFARRGAPSEWLRPGR